MTVNQPTLDVSTFGVAHTALIAARVSLPDNFDEPTEETEARVAIEAAAIEGLIAAKAQTPAQTHTKAQVLAELLETDTWAEECRRLARSLANDLQAFTRTAH